MLYREVYTGDMLARIILAVVVAVVVTLACVLLGSILVALTVQIAVTIGDFLKNYAAVIGVLAGLWWFFAGPRQPLPLV